MTKNETSFDLYDYLKERKNLIDTCLSEILSQKKKERELIEAMKYSLMAGGKRLRPVLCMAAAECVGGNLDIALPAACAIEMIHTYSLIHDDLPAMDNDDLRRGNPTCHRKFSESTAILAGDALLTHAFFILSNPEKNFEIFPEKETLFEIIGILSDAAGMDGMVEGQMMDMLSSWDNSSENSIDQLEKMHNLKTGRMIKASVEAGAVSAGAESSLLNSLLLYADHIGTAFQVVDDILNIEGNPEIMGKSTGSDARNNKATFPALLGLEKSKAYAESLVSKALNSLQIFGEQGLPLKKIATFIIERNY